MPKMYRKGQGTRAIPNPTDLEGLSKRLQDLLGRVAPVPDAWLSNGKFGASKDGKIGNSISLLPCTDYRVLTTAWRKALKWTPGLDFALSAMLASITSTESIGDQLWIKVIGPASCGKSTLCEAISVNLQYVVAKSTMRGFHSGFKSGSDKNEDNSLIAKLYNKTLVTKDGDTLLQSPNLGQILSEARDIYDSTSRTHYRNKMGKDYSGIRMTWILCGTSSLRTIDSSELGERFLDCVIMEGIDDDMEDEVLWRVANREDRNMGMQQNGEASITYEPELLTAMQLTGGYIQYLRENDNQLLREVTIPEHFKRKCVRLGKFVACMRARPSLKQEEIAEREFGARLVSQIIRLTKCLGVVLNEKQVNDRVMNRVTKMALDTSRGQVLDMMRCLYDHSEEGVNYQALLLYTGYEDKTVRRLLRFLKRIDLVFVFKSKEPKHKGQQRWKMTRKMRRLYKEIMHDK